jgi:PAS domain S-box-containing protein
MFNTMKSHHPTIPLVAGVFLTSAAPASAATFGQLLPSGGAGIVIGLSGILQLCVAIYAIKLNRLFGTGRVGWSLFWAFVLLALLHLVQSTCENSAATDFQVDLDIVYMIISILLLIGMAHLHAVLKQQQNAEGQRKLLERQMREELELQVEKKTDHLKRAVETLRLEIQNRERAEAQIREQARLLDLTHDAVVVQDLEGRIQYWNKGAERIYGWTTKEAVGGQLSEFFAADIVHCDQATKTVFERGRWEGEMVNRHKDGRTVLADEDWTLVYDTNEKPKSVMIVSADITEKRRLESQTLRLQRLESIGTLASGIAHDLNNVLTPLLISVQLLREKTATDEHKMLLDTLNRNAVRGAKLVKQILTFGRGVKGDRAILKLANVVQEVKQLVLDTFPKSLQLQIHIPDDLWTVVGDATQLHQVLLNLCVNARDAMPKGGTLLIQVQNLMLDEAFTALHLEAKAGPYVLLQVTDNGTGIPKSVQNRIFEPFFTTKDHGKGTGLGLSTCFTIIKNHGGFISCYSEPGAGSVFKVYLPANTNVPIAEQPPTEPGSLPSGHGELVLIVDDEQVIREFAQITLECYGYRTIVAANGAEAVSLYKNQPSGIAVVLLDMWMPIMDGPATIEALRAMNRQVVIVGTSGLGAAAVEKIESQMNCFIPKPYTTATLLQTLNKVLQAATPRPAKGAVATPAAPVPAPCMAPV